MINDGQINQFTLDVIEKDREWLEQEIQAQGYSVKDIYIAEGIINAETLGKQCIATAGKKISNIQKSIILRSPIETITIVLDPDAIDDAIKLGLDMIFYKKVKLLNWGNVNIKKDINDIGRDNSFKLLNELGYESYNSLIYLKNKLNEKRAIFTYN